MDLIKFYQDLEQLRNKGEILNAYGGSESYDATDDVDLAEFVESILTNDPDQRPRWLETFLQVYCWQFQSMHEGVEGYYCNFYGYSDYETIRKTSDYLQSNGYSEIAEPYQSGIADCKRFEYPADQQKTARQIDYWINWNTKPVWDFYWDILYKNKDQLLTK